MDKITYALLRKYIDNSLAGAGAVKGVPCQIQSIESIEGGNEVTFFWEDNEGNTHTSPMDVMNGAKGVKGDKGDTGAKGDKGDKGDTGATGAKGDKGDKGETGLQGVAGPAGAQGVQGAKGDKGDDGYPFLIYKQYDDISEYSSSDFPEIGLMFMVMTYVQDQGYPIYRYTGEGTPDYSLVTYLASEAIKGDKGDKGDTGAQGPQGIQGIQGEKGDKGDKGDTGATGAKGETGAQGPKGDKGDKGDTGAAGADGAKGDKGDKGDTGEGVPIGGTAGQVLAKNSGTDYDAGWITPKNSRVVELSETNIQTEVGTAKTVTVKYRVAGLSDTATYTSSDTSVATVAVTGHSSTGTSATDIITITPVANGDCTIKIAFANEVGYDAEYDYINVTVGAASGGSSVKKTRYTVTASSWSASANSDGYYTYTQILSPAVKSSPDVYVAGSTDSTQPTDAQRVQFGYVERCKVNGSTLTLYAKTKPTATFYIWVEGEEGTGSGDIVGNVVQPNGESSGGNPFLNKTKIAELVFTNDGWSESSTYSGYLEQTKQMTAGERTNANASNILMFTLLRYYYNSSDSKYNQTAAMSQHIIDLNQLVSDANAHSTDYIRLNLQMNSMFSATSKMFSVIDIRGWERKEQYSWIFNLYIDSSITTRDYKIIVEKLA